MTSKWKVLGISFLMLFTSIGLVSCSPPPTHCPVASKGGDNTRTVTPSATSTYTTSHVDLSPGTHVTFDGYSSSTVPNRAFIATSGATISTDGLVQVLGSVATQACFAHYYINALPAGNNSQVPALNVSQNQFVVRDVSIEGVGYSLKQDGDDLGISRVFFRQYLSESRACVYVDVGDNLTVADSMFYCAGQIFQGSHGTGDDHGLTVTGSKLAGALGWFDQSSPEPVLLSNDSFAVGQIFPTIGDGSNLTTATYVAAAGGYNPPPGLVSSNCSNITLYWPTAFSFAGSTIPANVVSAWQSKCSNVSVVYGYMFPSGSPFPYGSSEEPNSI